VNVSVMITTKNRVAELRRVCEALRQLNPSPLEILITADGCTDDTVKMVKTELSKVNVIVDEIGRGYTNR
jgi:glycosyltransferase involved in cell wall biosynthesis